MDRSEIDVILVLTSTEVPVRDCVLRWGTWLMPPWPAPLYNDPLDTRYLNYSRIMLQ